MKEQKLKILQVGVGAMGKRRLRDLSQRKDVTVALYDVRSERRAAAAERFGIKVFSTLDEALSWNPAALVISTPPNSKSEYFDVAFERGLHHFSEADIWTHGAHNRSLQAGNLISVPSASLRYLPVVRGLEQLIRDNIGSVLSYHHTLGTYMPAWHPGEGIEYYGRHRDTAPAREMVCFELHFLNAIFGPPTDVAGCLGKYGDLPGETEDCWSLLLRLKNGGLGQLSSTMACPKEYRRGCCMGSRGLATWDITSGEVTICTVDDQVEHKYQFGAIGAVLEKSYAAEINDFVDAVLGKANNYKQTYLLNQESTAALAAAEQSAAIGEWVKIERDAEPKLSPPRGVHVMNNIR